jgi:hypothetical protein
MKLFGIFQTLLCLLACIAATAFVLSASKRVLYGFERQLSKAHAPVLCVATFQESNAVIYRKEIGVESI